MKNLTLKNRPSTLTPLLVGLALGAVASLPSVAHAQLKESWELGVDAAKWRSSLSTSGTSYVTPGQPIVIRSSIADDGPGAACAGKYVRETNGVYAGRVFGIGTNVQAVTAGATFCVSAWTRSAAGGVPYVGINYTTAATGVAENGFKDTNECWLLSSDQSYQGPGCAGETISRIPVDGTWQWTSKTFVVPVGRTGFAQLKFMNFPPSAAGVSDGSLPPIDFDDIRLTAGACPATAPADTAPHVACTGTSPVCVGGDAANNAKCMDCNGNNGQAAATRPCPTAAAPICETAGANKGSCSVACTGDFGSAGASPCTVNTPFCVDVAGSAFKTCKPCAGNDGSGMMPACLPANPTCFTTGAKAGSCGRCTAAADCGGTTPRCDVGTGRCTDDCDTDADCGGKTSGKICDAGTLKCKAGCRGDNSVGNGCPAGEKCSSVDLKPGTCTPIPVPDAGADSGKPDAGPPPVDASVPDSSPVTPPDPGADSGAPVDPGATPPAADDPGGCAATPASTLGSSAALSMVLGLFVGAVARRRRRDGAQR
jgi:hypothetical protein